MPQRLLLLAVLFVAPLAGCWVPIEQGQAMESDLVKLKAEVAAQRKEMDESDARAERERAKLKGDQEAALKRVDAKIREVGEALEALNRAARKTGADLGVELEQAQTEMARLRGLFEELQAKHQALEQGLAQLKTDTDQKLAAAVRPDAKPEQKPAERPATKDAFYAAAKDKLDAGDQAGARQMFSEFLGKWKEDALAANAQYWIGESYYAEKRYREAIFEFKKVGDQYPKSEKAPDALLKIAYAFAELGLVDDAKLFLEEVGRSYPKASAAKLAKDKLAELSKKK